MTRHDFVSSRWLDWSCWLSHVDWSDYRLECNSSDRLDWLDSLDWQEKTGAQ